MKKQNLKLTVLLASIAFTLPAFSQVSAKTSTASAARFSSSPAVLNVSRTLKVGLSLAAETEKSLDKSEQNLLEKLWAKSEFQKAVRAVNVSDEAYETRLKSDNRDPYISRSLYNTIVPAAYITEGEKFYPCDANAVAPCMVIEVDSASGQRVAKAYVVGTAPTKLNGQLTLVEVRVARRDIVQKDLLASVEALAKNRADGIYVYSRAATKQAAVEQQQEWRETVEETKNEAATKRNACEAESLTRDEVLSKIQTVTDEEEKAQLRKEIAAVVEKQTTEEAKMGNRWGFNKCIVKAVRSETHPNHGLKAVRNFIILDVVNLISVVKNGCEKVLNTGKGILACDLWNGDIQRVNVKIDEFMGPPPFSAGIAFRGARKNLVAGGIGFANGAIDILEIKKFGHPLKCEGLQVLAASALGANGLGLVLSSMVGNIGITPITLSGSTQHKPILAGVVEYSTEIQLPKAVCGAGRYEISIDPDDT